VGQQQQAAQAEKKALVDWAKKAQKKKKWTQRSERAVVPAAPVGVVRKECRMTKVSDRLLFRTTVARHKEK
jgi:hypothetical protein